MGSHRDGLMGLHPGVDHKGLMMRVIKTVV